MAGVLLTASILFHIFHATFFLDFWSIWVGPKDIPEFKAEMLREMGKEDAPGPRPGKYPLGNRLYHLAVMVAGLVVIGTGIMMMWRVRTGLVERNPYLFADVDVGPDLRAARPDGRRLCRPRHRAHLLRAAAGEAVDHQGDDLRHHLAPRIPRVPRPGSLGRRS